MLVSVLVCITFVLSSFAIILAGKRELVALIYCLVGVLLL